MDKDRNLLFFALPPADFPYVDIKADGDQEPVKGSIWDDLKEAVRTIVKRDGIHSDAILPGQTKEGVLEDAVEDIYHDASGLYYWYFNPSDDRADFIKYQPRVNLSSSLREKVLPTVKDNLASMREINQIPANQDGDNLLDHVTDDITRYIQNWQEWYYDRKIDDDIEDYREQQDSYKDIYIDSDYGELSNILNTEMWDDVDNEPHS